MDSRLKIFVPRVIKPPFSNEYESAKAVKKLYGSGLGAKVLDQLLLDMEYHKPDKPTTELMLAFNAGKKYPLNHILHAMSIQYEEVEEDIDAIG